MPSREYEFTRLERAFEIRIQYELASNWAFDIYAQVVSEEEFRLIESNLDHGWSHIRRVLKHLKGSLLNSAEMRNRERSFFIGSQQNARAILLATRFHDIFEQLYAVKRNHAELGALVTLIRMLRLRSEHPELAQDLTDELIYSVLVIIIHHSDPSNLDSCDYLIRPMSDIASEALTDLEDGGKLAKKLTRMQIVELKASIGVYKTAFKDFDSAVAAFASDEELRKTIVVLAKRLALADKMDSMVPAVEANYRLVRSSWSFADPPRHFYLPITQNVIEAKITELEERKAAIAKSSASTAEVEDQIAQLRSFIKKVNDSDFSLSDELSLRIILGSGIAPDDFSRFIYELGRNFQVFEPTSYERNMIRDAFENRVVQLQYFADVFRSFCARVEHSADSTEVYADLRDLEFDLFDRFVEGRMDDKEKVMFLLDEKEVFRRLMMIKADRQIEVGVEELERMVAILDMQEVKELCSVGVGPKYALTRGPSFVPEWPYF